MGLELDRRPLRKRKSTVAPRPAGWVIDGLELAPGAEDLVQPLSLPAVVFVPVGVCSA